MAFCAAASTAISSVAIIIQKQTKFYRFICKIHVPFLSYHIDAFSKLKQQHIALHIDIVPEINENFKQKIVTLYIIASSLRGRPSTGARTLDRFT
jgi:hypothetical protein